MYVDTMCVVFWASRSRMTLYRARQHPKGGPFNREALPLVTIAKALRYKAPKPLGVIKSS